MENYDWTQFTRKIAVKSTIRQIYDAWTTKSEIEKWFLSNADYFDGTEKIDENQNIQKNNSYEWSWFLYDAVEKGKIIEANGTDNLKFSFAGDCLVEIKLSVFDDYVIVELTQSNIPTDEKSKKNIRLGCDFGWFFYLVNLKSVYEGGLDLRNKDPELKDMLNN